MTTYYVKNEGNDSLDGLSDATAWETIDHVNSINFQPGDSILFKAGGVWREQITVSKSGSEGNPITYSSYGSGPKPVINLAKTIINWNVYSGNIYVADVDFDIYQVFIDDKFMTLAHYPNNGYLWADEDTPDSEQNYLIDNNLGLSVDQVVGADIFLWGVDWKIDESRVIDYIGNKITFEGWTNCCTNYPMKKNKKYYLANKLWMLDKAGEWYYDNSLNKLYVWMLDSSHPTNYKIEGSKYLYGFHINNQENIIIDNFEIRNSVHSGVFIEDSNNFVISNNDIINSGTMKYYDYWEETGNGMYILDKVGNSFGYETSFILNNTIKNIIHKGIRVKGFSGVSIENNLVENVGIIGSDVYCPKTGTGILISSNSPNALIKGNIINDIGYNGIFFNQQNTIIENNYITNTMQVLEDGGGIYCGYKATGGSIITGNVITNTGKTKTGTKPAIYLDDGNNNIQVLNNSGSFATIGIFIHNGQYNTVSGNKFYDVTKGIAIQEDLILNEPGYIVGNVIENNTFFLLNEKQVVFKRGILGNLDFGEFDYNIYSNLYPEHLVREVYGENGIWKWEKYYSLNTWQTVHKQDQHSTFITQQGSSDPYDDSQFLINTDPSIKQFTYDDYANGKNWVDIYGNAVSWPITINRYDSKIIVAVEGDYEEITYELIPQDQMSVIYVDSEETIKEDGRGVNVIDGNPNTYWHTEW